MDSSWAWHDWISFFLSILAFIGAFLNWWFGRPRLKITAYIMQPSNTLSFDGNILLKIKNFGSRTASKVSISWEGATTALKNNSWDLQTLSPQEVKIYRTILPLDSTETLIVIKLCDDSRISADTSFSHLQVSVTYKDEYALLGFIEYKNSVLFADKLVNRGGKAGEERELAVINSESIGLINEKRAAAGLDLIDMELGLIKKVEKRCFGLRCPCR